MADYGDEYRRLMRAKAMAANPNMSQDEMDALYHNTYPASQKGLDDFTNDSSYLLQKPEKPTYYLPEEKPSPENTKDNPGFLQSVKDKYNEFTGSPEVQAAVDRAMNMASATGTVGKVGQVANEGKFANLAGLIKKGADEGRYLTAPLAKEGEQIGSRSMYSKQPTAVKDTLGEMSLADRIKEAAKKSDIKVVDEMGRPTTLTDSTSMYQKGTPFNEDKLARLKKLFGRE